jgi:hypothetical protein
MFEYAIVGLCFGIFLHSLANYAEIKLLKRRLSMTENLNQKMMDWIIENDKDN